MHFLRAGVWHRERTAAGGEIQEPKLVRKLDPRTGRKRQGNAAGCLRAVAAILLTFSFVLLLLVYGINHHFSRNKIIA